ncbi:MAG: glycine cleavage system protein GcvH [Bacteroidia bacterium]|nr:glycine cleavage system protein GcvH [Bacteroidia bacterium]MDW8236443.1 glycine cleavage system protein GcvH [Bacteroidia bacterium]
MQIPEGLYYSREHEWLRILPNGEGIVGITDYAQSQLGDIVYVDIPSVGKTLEAGAAFGTIEAVKTVSDLYMPVTGTILEKNPLLESSPEKVNQEPYGDGWMIKIHVQNPEEINKLLKAEEYKALVGA